MTTAFPFFKRSFRSLLFSVLSVFFLLFSLTAYSDELGEFLLKKIKANPGASYSDGALLLITRDLGWYEKHMAELPKEIQSRVQDLRIRVVGESTRAAAEAMGEPADIFLASGSCKPGRDIDILYVGEDAYRARINIESAIDKTTKEILSNMKDDPVLMEALEKGIDVPKSLTTDAMDVVASDLPNFGFKDLDDAIKKARIAFETGNSDAVEVLKKELHEAMKLNLSAQIKSSAKDMYRGAEGQRFFAANYLGDPDKIRRMVKDETGAWVLKAGGRDAIPEMLLAQVDALMPSGGRAKFAKVACDYAMFFKHDEGGIGGTAKYVKRIWGDVDAVAMFKGMDRDSDIAVLLARKIAMRPQNASAILAKAGLEEADLIKNVQNALHQTVTNQLMLDVNNLLKELDSIEAARGANAITDIDALFSKQLIKFDLNDLANGLAALSDVPGGKPEEILKMLQKEFGERAMGPNVLDYIGRQLKLFQGDLTDIITTRMMLALRKSKDISGEEYYELKRRIQNGADISDMPAAAKLKQARQEILYLSSVDMLELGKRSDSIDDIVLEWRKQRINAVIRTVPDELRQTVKELSTLPAGELKALGWLEAEIKLPMETRVRIKLLPDQMADMAERLQRRLSKQAISLLEWQAKTRQYIFNMTPTELGTEGDLGAMDAVFAVASGMYQTYSILNSSPAMKPDQENLALANAWVTSLPIVGDFANGIISGIEAGFTGNKRKALEAGLYVSIGIMAVVPGGQIPAMVTGMIMAGAPIAEGIYDARQAQNLIQAWIDSGDWDEEKSPVALLGIFDRARNYHQLTYDALLTHKGDVPYESEKADGLFSVPTINASIRDYAEKYVFPQYPRIKELRESLKLLFPDFNDRDWEDEYDAKTKVNTQGGKAALLFFDEYQKIRTQALNRTIAQLRQWAEEEYRIAKDYDGEVNRAKEKLRALESELRVNTLVSHADQSALSYSKVIKNTMEQETLPLSRYRIYKHYVDEYEQIAKLHRKIMTRLEEVPDGYRPSKWHLTGFPEFDRPRITKLAAMIENGRSNAVSRVEQLVRDFGFYSRGGYNPDDPCQKKALQTLLALRYKVSFIENLADYFTQLAESESAWSDAYDAAQSRYIEVRDRYANVPNIAGSNSADALGDAVITFVAAMPYALASGERDLYRDTAGEFKVKMSQAMRDYEYAGFLTGAAGKPLEECLRDGLKIELTPEPVVPEMGKTTVVTARLDAGTKPLEIYWRWQTEGPLKLETSYGEKVKVTVDGPGILIASMMDDFRNSAKLMATSNIKIVPKDGTEEQDEKDKLKEVAGDKVLAETINTLLSSRDWKGLIKLLAKEKKNEAGHPEKEKTERVEAVTSAIRDLIEDRRKWLSEGKDYLTELLSVTRKSWESVNEEIKEKHNNMVVECSSGCRDDNCKNSCKEKADTYMKDCMGQLESDHNAETERITGALSELPSKIAETVFTEPEYEAYLEKADALGKAFQLPYPYPGKVIPLLDYDIPCLKEGSEKIKPDKEVTLDVTIKGPSQVIEVGTLVNLSSSVGGGSGPYSYQWSGVSSSSSNASFTPSYAGDKGIGLMVTDSQGNSGEAFFTVRVAAARIKIKGVKGEVAYGSEDLLSASGMGLEEKPVPSEGGSIDCATHPENPFCVDTSTHSTYTPSVSEKYENLDNDLHREYEYIPDPSTEFWDEPPVEIETYRVVWQSEPGLTFDPPEGPNDSTKVIYDRMGEVKIWCELLKNIEGSYQTVAESEQVTVKVIPPDFSITYEPANGKAYIGQQVIATIHAKPAVNSKIIDYRWFDPATSNRMEMDGNGGRISFKIKDTNPLKLKALARVPVHGDEIGEIESSYTGVAFGVNAWMIQPPNLPRTWDPKAGGLKTISRGSRATGELIRLKAELQGGPAPEGVRWKWQVNEGTALSNDISQTPTVSRSEEGTITARATARTSDGSLLGEAEVTVDVVKLVSPPANAETDSKGGKADPKTGTENKKDEARELVEQSRDEISRGNMQAAAESALKAKERDPKIGSQAVLEIARSAKKSGWRSAYDRDFKKAIQDLEISLRLVPGNADTQKKIEKVKEAEKKWPQVLTKVPEFNSYVSEKKPFSAQKTLLEIQSLQSDMPGGMSNPVSQKIREDFEKAFIEYNNFALKWEQKNKEYFIEKNWQGILDISLEAQKRELSPGKAKDVQGAIDLARKMLAETEKSVTAPPDSKKPGTAAGVQDQKKTTPDKTDVSRTEKAKTELSLSSPIIPEPPNPPAVFSKGGISLNLAKTVYAPGENISLEFAASSGVAGNPWVGMLPSAVPHGSNARNDQNDTTFQSLNGRQSGTLTFKAPLKAGQYDLRLSSADKDSEYASVSFKVDIPMHSAGLTLTKNIFAPKEDIKLDFRIAGTMAGNTWVGMIPASTPHGSTARNDQHDITFQNVNGRTSGTMGFKAPVKEGKYSFRLNEKTNDREMASVDFEVAVPEEGNSLTPDKTVYGPGEDIKLDFTVPAIMSKNTWVGMIPAAIPHGSTARNDQHDTTFQNVNGRPSGRMYFKAPVKEGKYSFRLNENTNDKEIATVDFEVAVPVEGNSLTPDKTVYAPEEDIKLDFTVPAIMSKNTWVGMIPAAIPHGSTTRNDQHDTAFQNVNGRPSGRMYFKAPVKEGKYSFRLNENTNDKEIATVDFEVAVPFEGNTLKADKTVYSPNEDIKLDFTVPAAITKKTWIGIIPSGIPHGSTSRNDQSDLTFQNVNGRESGRMYFKAPSKPGKYDFRLNETTNNRELKYISFTVVEVKK